MLRITLTVLIGHNVLGRAWVKGCHRGLASRPFQQNANANTNSKRERCQSAKGFYTSWKQDTDNMYTSVISHTVETLVLWDATNIPRIVHEIPHVPVDTVCHEIRHGMRFAATSPCDSAVSAARPKPMPAWGPHPWEHVLQQDLAERHKRTCYCTSYLHATSTCPCVQAMRTTKTSATKT